MRRNLAAVTLLLVTGMSAAERKLTLRGQIEPPPSRAHVTLSGATTPYSATTLSGSKGRFTFKNLEPGAYTVMLFVPGRGQSLRTVEVSASLADEKGRVEVVVPFTPSVAGIEQEHSVSVRELSIPNKARNEYRKAQKRLGKRDVDGAIAHLERAAEIAPHFVAAWNNLGTIAYQSARYSDAERYFREALKHEPGSYSPVVNLGGTLLSLNRFEEALKYNQYAVADRPDDALANSQMGMNHFFLGDNEKAIIYLNKAKRLDPAHFSHPQLMLARIHSARGDHPSTIAELEDFLARHPDAPNANQVRDWLQKLRERE